MTSHKLPIKFSWEHKDICKETYKIGGGDDDECIMKKRIKI